MESKVLHISTSPHLTKQITTADIMRNVVYALLPVAGFAVYSFGLNALLVLSTAVFSSVLTEHLLCRWSNKTTTISDWSAAITGLLYGLTLPPTLPLWMVFLGGFVAIALGKFIFGGLGYNVFNPALVGRAFLQAAFPVAMTTWTASFLQERFVSVTSSVFAMPFIEPTVDGISGATPLSAWKFDNVVVGTQDLVLGFISGSTGETCAILILAGGVYLAVRNMLNWRIPVAILATVYIICFILNLANPEIYPTPEFMLFSGGLMIGAVFMATDMVASPLTSGGVVVYGVLIGLLIVVIRIWGGLPEGVMYAILIANAMSPHIDKAIQPRVYGTSKKASAS
ncbi:MAG: RnfABCDGE type electron transport complex subunit D [Bacteroidota bacterium]